ncbi:MAG: GFA family protein [Proteobacteria bacterium]|nr:GFA family protein [Pseudomonadota bacterium]
MANAKPDVTRGHCMCHAIEYEFEGPPKWVMHCHCESCRRAVSSAVATYVGVNIDQFRYLKGTPAIYESSPGVKRYFCGTCGSPMAYAGSRWPKEVHLLLGTLDDPEKFSPTGHAHITERVNWFDVHDDLPRYATVKSRENAPVAHGPKKK